MKLLRQLGRLLTQQSSDQETAQRRPRNGPFDGFDYSKGSFLMPSSDKLLTVNELAFFLGNLQRDGLGETLISIGEMVIGESQVASRPIVGVANIGSHVIVTANIDVAILIVAGAK